MIKVLFVFGTRPEAIKMAPVIREMKAESSRFKVVVCVTAQHREMLDQVLDLFDIKPNYDLDIMTKKQTLPGLTSSVLLGVTGYQLKPGHFVNSRGYLMMIFYPFLPVVIHPSGLLSIQTGL
ncbi:MAG: UDP-N-acetylglucosamine 2-epimerase (non-hydrolyzing), partial [Desulfobacteraceae bacterium]|nr:UDP-N-acetylglucosamine 2-epimerase (non-hydrolyzing) [Desulfobacteraceae bacterium]MBC2720062.1 UDP-N-acetylglucosamine 2-epimerase [Desulfobacteraceae bacterium]